MSTMTLGEKKRLRTLSLLQEARGERSEIDERMISKLSSFTHADNGSRLSIDCPTLTNRALSPAGHPSKAIRPVSHLMRSIFLHLDEKLTGNEM